MHYSKDWPRLNDQIDRPILHSVTASALLYVLFVLEVVSVLFLLAKQPCEADFMTNPSKNLFADFPANLPEELFETLVSSPDVRIERIVSHGHASPEDFWYDQDTDEWVLLLSGAARLQFENSDTPVEMAPGQYVLIPAHTRHRVAWTDPTQPTIWLAVHYGPERSK